MLLGNKSPTSTMRNMFAAEPLPLLAVQQRRTFEQQRGGEDVAGHRGHNEMYRTYLQKVEEISKLQESCTSSIYRQQKGLKEISSLVKKCSKGPSEADALDEIKEKIKMQSNAFYEMEAFLPRKNGPYLRLVLGNVNVTLLSKQLKFAYKDEYEKFKLYLTAVLLLFSFTCYFFVSYRFLDAVLNFLLVWYYCTLTIRESILITNGSRIKGWWVSHHYVSAFLSAVMLTWPDGNLYKTFRNQFLAYSLYQSFVQCLQCYYQSGCLYRLRALGERHNMDLTVGKNSSETRGARLTDKDAVSKS